MQTTQKNMNEDAVLNPKVGDYWTERVFCPYLLVVRVDGDEITILNFIGGDKYPSSRIRHKEHWEIDPSKYMIVDKKFINDLVKYKSIDGFVADVINTDKTMSMVKEFEDFQKTKPTEPYYLNESAPKQLKMKYKEVQQLLLKDNVEIIDHHQAGYEYYGTWIIPIDGNHYKLTAETVYDAMDSKDRWIIFQGHFDFNLYLVKQHIIQTKIWKEA